MKIIVIFNLIIFSFIQCYSQNTPSVKEGVIDLKNWDFEKDGIVRLDGQWSFYWQELLSPDQILNQQKSTNYIDVPNVWSSGKNTSKIKYPAHGFATYKVKILLPKDTKNFRLNIKNIRSAFKVWINGSQVYQTGRISKKQKECKAGLFEFNEFFINQENIPSSDTLELVIEVSNYSTKLNAGINHSLIIGTKNQILKNQMLNYIIGFFSIGIFLIFGIYHFLLFFFRTKEKSTLYFSLMSFSIILRTLYNQEILENFFHNFHLTNIIDYGSVPLFGLFLSLYFFELYKKEFHKIPIYIIIAFSSFLTFLSFFSLETVEVFYYFYFGIVFLPMLYIVFWVMPIAFKKKYVGVFWAFLGIFFMFITANSDFLYLRRIINIPFTTTYGFIFFSLFQSINIAKRYSSSLSENVELNKILKIQNENLEKIIEKRTKMIVLQNNDLESKNTELVLLSDQLQLQNEEMKSITNELEYNSKILKMQTEELKTTNLELEKLSIVATHTTNIVIIFDENFKLEWANNAFFETYKINSNFNLNDFNFLTNSTLKNIREILNDIKETKKSVSYESNIITNPNKWYQTTISPIFELNVLKKIIVIETDISKLKKAENEIYFQKNVIEGSIRYARTIQNAILPNILDYKSYFESFIIFKPKDIVSGDFFWIKEYSFAEKDFFIAVADCTGHGVPGAFMSMIGITLLNEIIVQKKILLTSKILDELSHEIKTLLKQTSLEDIDGMDIALCRVNFISKKIIFSGAKRPLFVYDSKNQKIIKYSADRFSIGGIHANLNNPFNFQEISVNSDDILYLCSDGLIDQHNFERKKYGSLRFMQDLTTMGNYSIANQKNYLENVIDDWQKEEIQRDDITILGIKM